MVRFGVSMGALLGLALALPAAAQNTPASGVVTESGRPIAGASVLVDGANPILTDQDGRFTTTVPAGDHKFKVALHGYQPVEHAVTITKNQAAITDFALDPVVQIMALTVPASLKQGATGKAQLTVKNTAATDYSIDAASLRFIGAGGKDRSADIKVESDAANPTKVKAGQTATLAFNLTPGDTAAAGKVTVQAGVFAFDTALGTNLLSNGSFETGDDTSADSWAFGGDNTDLLPGFSGSIVKDTAVTGNRSVQIKVPEAQSGDDRAYWGPSPWASVTPGKTYALSGYVKTDSVVSDPGFGADIYVPVVGDSPYQQPYAPWITGTRDWRKDIVVFSVSPDATNPQAVPRGQLMQASGTAWFDNISLTQGTEDGSLSVTGGDQALEVTSK